jgi:hypothetical protein
VIRAGLRRVLVFFLIVLGGVAAISATLAALADRSVPHALSIGYYLAGCGCLVMSFGFGVRGPTRAESTEEEADYRPSAFTVFGNPRGGRIGRRERRKATPEERREARLASLGLFVFGVLLIMLGAAFDPARRAF